ncbi:MAG: M20/M25/M40 family metallo-hydrolase [Planctomycetes bacterium]|nr:M20/M25/M40 family metallo-hydrolase [Planctomycetota bacterium]
MTATRTQTDARTITDAQATQLLVDLVSTPSLSMHEHACAALLTARMSALGLESFIDASGSAVGVRGDRSPDATEIVLLGHIDTVPGVVPVRMEGDVFYGRGSVDAKGPLAAFTIAAGRAALPPGVRVRVIGAVEEESATSKGARFAATNYRADACIIGEPSGVEGVTLGYKGRLIARLDLETDSSHSAGPEATAAELAFEVWSRVRAACEARTAGSNRIFDQVQTRLRSIHSDHDGLADRAVLTIGFRIPPGVLPTELEAICAEATSNIGARSNWHFVGHEVAHVADRSNVVVRALMGAIRSETSVGREQLPQHSPTPNPRLHRGGGFGMTPTPKLKTGTSDMNVIGPIWNCPIAAYGPGDSSLDHTPNEHIRISEYLASIRILTRAIEAIAGDLL